MVHVEQDRQDPLLLTALSDTPLDSVILFDNVHHICCYCMGTYFGNNKFLFIDHTSTIDKQRNEGTLLSSSDIILPLWATHQVNRLTTEQELLLQQGPMRS
eukprot:1706168-Prorocentrum_lima.AAC.1